MSRGTQSLLTRGRLVMAACIVLVGACTDNIPTESQLASGAVLAAVQGSSNVYTTDNTGTVVNGNIYEVSGDVYISGGPQNTKASGPANGTYYYQVTDPSGKTLLSSDPAACRQLTVANGRVQGSAGPPCKHANGPFNPANGATPVKLAPFSTTPNAGGEYKVWMVPTSKATVSPSDPKALVFKNADALTDNFKVNSSGEAPQGSCAPSSSLSVLVAGADVTAYVPKGNWSITPVTGIGVTNIEGSAVTPTLVPTVQVVNSCATNALTGETVCVANDGHVYLLSGTTLNTTLTSGGSGLLGFSGGVCTNCSVAMDATHNRVVIGLANGFFVPAFQILNLGTTPTFEPVFNSPSGMISEDPLIDPIRNLLLSAAENNTYEIVDITNSTAPLFYENHVSIVGELDSSGEDCSTGIALAPGEFSGPSEVYLADLTQATFVAGSPGTWTAPSQTQILSESFLSAGASGLAVAQGTHTGVVTGEFGGNEITAIALPATSGTGIPAIGDWLSCAIAGFTNGFDPHTVTAYKSPSNGDAIAVLANAGATSLAIVDLTKMLDPAVVPRTVAGHGCAAGVLPATVVRFVAVP